jgi:hypothetical protein
MEKAVLLIALCLSMIAFATPYAVGILPEASVTHPITVISPQNTTYNIAADPFDLPLNFVIDVPRMAMIESISYSLDGAGNVTISGNTSVSVGYGHHDIVVYATDIFGDTYASEATYFTVSIQCDVDGDGVVSIDDVVIVSGAYGATPEDPNWNPNADIAYHYGRIDVFDLVSVVFHYGETTPW